MSDFRKAMMDKYFTHTTINDIKLGIYKLPYVEFSDLTGCLNRIDKLEHQLTQKDKQIELLLGCVENIAKVRVAGHLYSCDYAKETLEKYKEMTR